MPSTMRNELWLQMEAQATAETAELGAKVALAKAACKRMRAEVQAQQDKTASAVAELAASQVGPPLADAELLGPLRLSTADMDPAAREAHRRQR